MLTEPEEDADGAPEAQSDERSAPEPTRPMSASDAAAVVNDLEALGVRLLAMQWPDGSARIYCWRFPEAAPHRDRINRLLEQIDAVPANASLIAEHLARRSPPQDGARDDDAPATPKR
jgi:hypothetical protein